MPEKKLTLAEKLAAVKAKKADALKKKAAPNYGKGREPGKLFGAPHVTTGPLADSDGGVNVMKSFAIAAGQIAPEQCKAELDLSRRIHDVYGAFFPFSNRPGSVLVPVSGGFLPTTTNTGAEIPGAKQIKKEIDQRLLTVKSVDLDELRTKALRGDSLATKALNTLSDLAGGSTVPPPSLGDLIDLQRNLEVFSRLGANNVTLPPNGRMTFPKLTGGSTAYWVGETATVTDSAPTTGSLSLEVKKLAVRVPFTLELMRFSDQTIEAMVRVDMAKQAALKADLAQLEGTGGTQIKGLVTYPTAAWSQGVDKLIPYTVTASTLQPEDVEAMMAGLPDGVEVTGWAFRPDLFAKLKNRRADGVVPGDGRGPFVFDLTRSGSDDGPRVPKLSGAPVVTSRQVSNTRGSGAQTYVLAGYWADWIVGRLGVMEFMTDPFTQLAQMQTVVQLVQFIDAGPRHSASFTIADSINVS